MLLRKIKAKFVSILLFSTSSDFSETMRVAVGEIIQIKIFEVVNVSWLFSCPRLISLNDFFFFSGCLFVARSLIPVPCVGKTRRLQVLCSTDSSHVAVAQMHGSKDTTTVLLRGIGLYFFQLLCSSPLPPE